MVVATHTMKINGVVYRAGEGITSPDEKPVSKVEIKDDKTFSKSDIMTMKVADLRELASKNGIERPDELTGTELKDILIERFGL